MPEGQFYLFSKVLSMIIFFGIFFQVKVKYAVCLVKIRESAREPIGFI